MEQLKDVGLEMYKDLDFSPSREDFNYLTELAKEKFNNKTPYEISVEFSKYTYKEWYKILNNIEIDTARIKKRHHVSTYRAITYRTLSEYILNKLPLNEFESLGGDVEKLKRKLNEYYQYNNKCFARTNRGDYSLLIELVEKNIYVKKFID